MRHASKCDCKICCCPEAPAPRSPETVAWLRLLLYCVSHVDGFLPSAESKWGTSVNLGPTGFCSHIQKFQTSHLNVWADKQTRGDGLYLGGWGGWGHRCAPVVRKRVFASLTNAFLIIDLTGCDNKVVAKGLPTDRNGDDGRATEDGAPCCEMWRTRPTTLCPKSVCKKTSLPPTRSSLQTLEVNISKPPKLQKTKDSPTPHHVFSVALARTPLTRQGFHPTASTYHHPHTPLPQVI